MRRKVGNNSSQSNPRNATQERRGEEVEEVVGEEVEKEEEEEVENEEEEEERGGEEEGEEGERVGGGDKIREAKSKERRDYIREKKKIGEEKYTQEVIHGYVIQPQKLLSERNKLTASNAFLKRNCKYLFYSTSVRAHRQLALYWIESPQC